MAKPKFIEDKAFHCLREGDIDGFHRNIEEREIVDFANCDLKGTDFREADLTKVILKNAYLRDANLCGIDLRHLDLEGCSIRKAKISGTFFPCSFSAAEIQMSQKHGTRLRNNC